MGQKITLKSPEFRECRLEGDDVVPLDPQIRALFGETVPDLAVSSAEDMRRFYKARELPGRKVGQVASALDRYIPGPGGELGVRVYTPFGTGPFPLMLYFHGGGWVAGNLESHDPIARNLCAGAGAVVVAVDYRLAPEHRFPAATDDCMCALDWLAHHAGELEGDATRIAVAGDSAGGNLAAVTALRARDEGGPRLAGRLLIYPVTAHYTRGTRSISENGRGYLLTREAIEFFWASYLDDPANARNPHTAPLEITDLSGLPPAMVITAEFDPLRDEGEEYGERLQQAGVPTIIRRYDGMIHGFFALTGILDKTDLALDEACTWLTRCLAANSPIHVRSLGEEK